MLRNRKLIYKILISVIFGLLGFWANFHALDFVQFPDFKVSILFGLLFPLLIALSWGWRYGLLSALAGGCQSMWWLWYTDGYGFLYAVPVFTLWVVWHGLWADYRRVQKRKWYYSQYIVEIGFRVLSELGFYTIFRWLVSFNPPPWAPELTQNIVPYSWVHFVVVKHIIVAYILLLFCHVLLRIGPVRRFFMLEEETDHTEKTYIISASIIVGVLFWVIHSLADYFVFYRGENLFPDLMIANIPPQSLFTRNLFLVMCLVVGVILSRLLSSLNQQRNLLKKSENRYRSVFENSGAATIIIEEDYTISMANMAFEKLSGHSKEELEDRKKWTEFVVDEDLKRMKEFHDKRRVKGEESPTEYEFRFIDRNGPMNKAQYFE